VVGVPFPFTMSDYGYGTPSGGERIERTAEAIGR